MQTSNHDRFKGADWYSEMYNCKPIIGGAGGIGSWTALALTRMGAKCVVYDDDRYEELNKSGQCVRTKDIGKLKVDALNEICKEFCDEGLYSSWQTRFTEDSMSGKIMIAGFDSIASRKIFFEVWKNNCRGQQQHYLYIDGRLEAEMYQIFAFTANNMDAIEDYENNQLFDDTELPEGQCTLKQTSHVAMKIASSIACLVANHLTNMKYRNPGFRTIPYFTEFNSELMLYTQKMTP
jgi:molybdopterin/thiamine biosynthesis adenylyltransferase